MKGVEENEKKAQDVIAVLALQDKHPLLPEQAAALVEGVCEMTKTASFRAWFSKSVLDDETVEGVVKNLASHHLERSMALTALRNLCACGERVQNSVARQLRSIVSSLPPRVLELQVIANAVVQNAASAAMVGDWLKLLDPEVVVTAENCVVMAALLHNVRCWSGQRAERRLLPKLAELYCGGLGDDRHDVWFAGLVAFCEERPFAELVQLLAGRPRVLLVAMKQFGNRFSWTDHAQFVAAMVEQHLELVAELTADATEEGRAACRVLAENKVMPIVRDILRDESRSHEWASALQLAGNLAFRNDARVSQQLLDLEMLPRVIKLLFVVCRECFNRSWS
jgi:hypothetical protein